MSKLNKEVKIFIPKDSEDIPDSESSLDKDRTEMPWEHRQEDFIEKVQTACLEASQQHDQASKSHKKKYIRYSVPAIVLPIVFGAVSNFIPAQYEFVQGIALSVTGILTGINTFFNHGRKTEKHNEYSGRYSELAGFISTELCKPKKFRVQLDVFLERVTTRKNDLDNHAPML